MEHINKLVEQVATLKSWVEKANVATTLQELDEAKVAGLQNYQATVRQVHRAYHEFTNLVSNKRAEVSSANFAQVRATAQNTHQKVITILEDAKANSAEATSVEVMVETPKSKTTKSKSTKKAKK